MPSSMFKTVLKDIYLCGIIPRLSDVLDLLSVKQLESTRSFLKIFQGSEPISAHKHPVATPSLKFSATPRSRVLILLGVLM